MLMSRLHTGHLARLPAFSSRVESRFPHSNFKMIGDGVRPCY